MEIADPRLGSLLQDRYLVQERVMAGSMAVVYRGERTQLGRPVAIKFLNESYASTEDGLRRFQVEARAMSRLAHPNVVGVIDFGVAHGAPYLVMDFVAGTTLRDAQGAGGRLPVAQAINVVRQVLAGLAHAHANNIVHRDVKPENILLTEVEGHGQQVRIVDFGLAKLRDEASFTDGVAVGTPSYMSPEQTIGDKVDARTDVYAVGILLYELLAGKKPFFSESPFDVMRMHREVAPPPLALAAPDAKFTPALEAVVQRALAKSKDGRFASAQAFLSALEATPEALPESAAPQGSSNRVILVLLLAILLLGAAAAVVWLTQGAK